MPPLRIALAQVDGTVGGFAGNADIVSEWVGKAREQGADLVAFPEMALTGYPPEDLVLRNSFAAAAKNKLRELAARLAEEGCGEIAAVGAYLDRADEPTPPPRRPRGPPAAGARAAPSPRPAGRRAAERGGAAVRREGRRRVRQAPSPELR